MLVEHTETANPGPGRADFPKAVVDRAISHSPAIFYALDRRDGARMTFISPNVEAITGFAPKAFLEDARFFPGQVHPDDRPEFERATADPIGDAGAVRTFRFRNSDGEDLWFRDTLHAGPQGDDLVGCMIDITRQRRAEQSLQDLRTLRGAIIDTALDAIIVTDLDGRITEFNPVAETLFGHDRDAAIGQSLGTLIIPSELRRRHQDRMRRYRESGNRRLRDRVIETQAMRADGGRFPAEIHISEIMQDGEPRLLMELWDMTRQVEAKRERKRLLRLLEDAVECIPNGFGIYDNEEKLILCNRAFAEFYGLTPQDVTGSTTKENAARALSKLDTFDGHPVRNTDAAIAAAAVRVRQADNEPIEMRMKTGQWLQITSNPIADGGRVHIRTDITRLKDAEASLRESEEQFRAMVEGSPTAMRVGDLESGEILYESPAAAKLIGWCWPPDRKRWVTENYVDVDECAELVDQLLETGAVDNKELRLKRTDGEVFWASMSSRAIDYHGKKVCLTNFVDLTEQKAREAELKQARETLEDAIESLVEGFALYDKDDRLITCNQRYRDFNTMTADVLVPGVKWEDFIRIGAERGQYVEAIGRVEEFLEDRKKDRQELRSDLEFQQTDGRWFRFSNQRTRQGGIVVTRRDFTGRKEMERALQDSEALIRKVLEACPIPVRMWRPDSGQVLYESPAVGAVFGRRDAGKDPITPDRVYVDVADRTHYLEQLYKDGAVDNLEMNLRRADGMPFWAAVSARRVEYQNQDAIVSSIIDLTERRTAEEEMARQREALRASDERFRRLLEAHPIPVGMTRAEDGRVIYESPAARELFAYDDPPGTERYATNHFVDPADRRAYVEQLHNHGAVTNYEVQLSKSDGTPFWAAVSARMITYQDEDVIVSSVLDLSERRAVEEEMARQREALHQNEKLSALGSLLAGVAHELNNPLSVVVGQALLLEETATDPKIAERAAKIGSAADRCSRIVRAFLAMARQQPSQRTAVNVNDVIESTLEVIGYSLKTSGVEVRLALAGDLPDIWIDADQLNQVVSNLAVNAQQAMAGSDGPNRLRIATTHDKARGKVTIAVEDTGPGIPPEIRSRIFEPFFTTKEVGKGTGIGLAVCHRIVNSLNGDITVESQSGRGAQFKVVLPVATPPVLPDTDIRAPGRKRRTGRVLVIDDEVEAAAMIGEILVCDGHRVTTATSGREALRLLARHEFDVILSDLRMPDMDGPRLHDTLKTLSPSLLERVAFVTGDTFSATVSDFLQESGRPYAQKPFSPAEVRRLVAQVLEGADVDEQTS